FSVSCTQLLIDFMKRDVVISHDHQGVEQKVRHLVDNLRPLASLRGNQDFASFFRNLFLNLVMSACEKLGCVGPRLWSGLAGSNDTEHAVENSALCLRRFLVEVM